MVFVEHDELLNIADFFFKKRERVNGEWPVDTRVFWNMFSRALFIIGLMLVLMPTFTGKLRGISALLGSHFWTPLARLTFSTYLIHYLIIFWYLNSSRSAVYIYSGTLWFNCFATTTISYALAIPFSMIFEVPFMNIEKFLLFPPKERTNTHRGEGDSARLLQKPFNVNKTVSLKENTIDEE